MASRRQLRVGTQWLYADDAEKILKEAIRVREAEERERGALEHRQPWIRRYVFSTDHKWIGIQYGITALLVLLFGFSLMLLMRLQLGWPGQAFSIMKVLGSTRAPGGILLPEAYNQLGAMHGTIMVFLAIVPLAVGAFGNYFVPLQIKNSDATLHNVHAMPAVNSQFNEGQPVQGMVSTKKFDKVEAEPFKVKCDVHGWMKSYMIVLPHPYHGVSGMNGQYTISGLPPGNYTIEAWHEKYGKQEQNITVGAKEQKQVNFTFKG